MIELVVFQAFTHQPINLSPVLPELARFKHVILDLHFFISDSFRINSTVQDGISAPTPPTPGTI